MTNEHDVPDSDTRSDEPTRRSLTPAERILLLDLRQRSGLGRREFCALIGVSRHTLFDWRRRFARHGPAGLTDQRRGAPRGSRLPDATQRAIVLLKQRNPEWGCERIREVFLRGEGYSASAGAIRTAPARVGRRTPRKDLVGNRMMPKMAVHTSTFARSESS